MISQTVEYALRAVVYLASNPDKAFTTQQIATVTKVPQSYLSKIMQTLSRSGIVLSQRGLGGGFLLAHSPERMTALTVVNAVDPIERMKTCPPGLHSAHTKNCPLHRNLDKGIEAMERSLASMRISDLVDHASSSLCVSERSAARKTKSQADTRASKTGGKPMRKLARAGTKSKTR